MENSSKRREVPSESQLPSKKRKASLGGSFDSTRSTDDRNIAIEQQRLISGGQDEPEKPLASVEAVSASSAVNTSASSSREVTVTNEGGEKPSSTERESVQAPLAASNDDATAKDLPPPTAKRRATTGEASSEDPIAQPQQDVEGSQPEASSALGKACPQAEPSPSETAPAVATTNNNYQQSHPKSQISPHRLPSKKRARLDSMSTTTSSQQSQRQRLDSVATASSITGEQEQQLRQRLDSFDRSVTRKFSVGDLSLSEFGDRKLSINSQEQGSTKSAKEDRKLSFDLHTGKPAGRKESDASSDRKLSFDLSGRKESDASGDRKLSFDFSSRKESDASANRKLSFDLNGRKESDASADRKLSFDLNGRKESDADRKLSFDLSGGVGISARKESLGGETSLSNNSRRLSFDLDDIMNLAGSQEGGAMHDTKNSNSQNRRHRTSSLSSLDDDLNRRKWSQDSTLHEFSPSRKPPPDSAVGTSHAAGLPKFDDLLLMGGSSAPKIPDVGEDEREKISEHDRGTGDDLSLSMKAPPPVDAITMTTSVVSSLAEAKMSASSKPPFSKQQPQPQGDEGSRERKDSVLPEVGDENSDGHNNSNHDRRKESFSSSLDSAAGEAAAAAGAALEHLDALRNNKESRNTASGTATSRERKGSLGDDDDTTSTAASFASKEQRVLLEAIALTTGGGGGSVGVGRERLESIGSQGFLLGRERFESMGSMLDGGGLLGSRRERLESWGGMSDLSGLHLGAGVGANHVSGAQAVDIMAMAEEANLPDIHNPPAAAAVPSRIAMGRDRFNSIASLSEASLTGLPTFEAGADMATIDIQAVVSATMASMGGQLAEVAGAVEAAAGLDAASTEDDLETDDVIRAADESENSSAASPMIGAAADRRGRARSSSVNSGVLSVDHEAIAVAVDAAHAAAAALDLATIGRASGSVSSDDYKKKSKKGKSAASARRNRRQLPLKTRGESTISESEQAKIRQRARAAAAAMDPLGKATAKPLKKRAKRKSPENKGGSPSETPKHANRQILEPEGISSALLPPVLEPSSSSAPKKAKSRTGGGDKANQKWEASFEALITFINSRREEETKGLPDEERDLWVWDGNVPTNQIVDGKKLGRWVNNQRTAKSKGSLKEERIRRLEDAGLKWTVMTSNSWNDTLSELKNYIKEQTQGGKEWDGNVPTNYIIKARPDGQFAGEDRNLGRWINRQRGLFHSGKLKKERKAALDKLGLKWSMLDSTSWDGMYELLLKYIQEKKETTGKWDGNVPTGYKTQDDPPRNLGRWINRQRTANVKRKLKPAHFEKLNAVGLKWSIHDKKTEEIARGEVSIAAAPPPPPPADPGQPMPNEAPSNNGVIPERQLSVAAAMESVKI